MRTPPSLLYRASPQSRAFPSAALADLHMDSIIGTIAGDLAEHRLEEFYLRHPVHQADVEYRLAISRDLMREPLYGAIEEFLAGYGRSKRYFANAAVCVEPLAKQKWHLDGAHCFVRAAKGLAYALQTLPHGSLGLEQLQVWIEDCVEAPAFQKLSKDAGECMKQMDTVAYQVEIAIDKERAWVSAGAPDEDYCAGLEKAFDRFDLSGSARIVPFADLQHSDFETIVISGLRRFFQSLFQALGAFCAEHATVDCQAFDRIERELLFYAAYFRYQRRPALRQIPFSLPAFGGVWHVEQGIDLALAQTGASVVPNGFALEEGERHIVLTGPNQGGKTTFARMAGQCVCFALLGLPVPCETMELPFFGGIATHFPVMEDSATGWGRLKEELERLSTILRDLPADSLVVLNELFASTTQSDGVQMGARVLELLDQRGCICLYVTHLFGLASLPRAASYVAQIAPGEARTYRVIRRPADGMAYGKAMLEKYRLHPQQIKERTDAAFAASSDA